MRGRPLTRAGGPGGRWAYTLYDGAGKTPFLHALDTSRRTARCIELARLAHSDLSRARLTVDAKEQRVTVRRGHTALAAVDTRTFQVTAVR